MSIGTPAVHTKGKALCGVCGNKMERIPLPPTTYVAIRDGSTVPTLLGRPGKIRPGVLKKMRDIGAELIEVVPVQYACLNDETIQTFWFRKDGLEGDLWHVMKLRNAGEGPEVVREMPGALEEIDGAI